MNTEHNALKKDDKIGRKLNIERSSLVLAHAQRGLLLRVSESPENAVTYSASGVGSCFDKGGSSCLRITSAHSIKRIVWRSRPSALNAGEGLVCLYSINDLFQSTENRCLPIRLQNGQLQAFLAYVTSRYRGMCKFSTQKNALASIGSRVVSSW